MISAWAPPHDTGYGRAALSRIALQARLPSQTSRYSEPYTTNSLCARTPTRHPHAVKTIMSKRTDQITTPRPGKGGLRRGPQSVSCKGGGRGASHPSLRHVSYPSRLPSLNAPALLAQHVRSCLKLWIISYILFLYYGYVIHKRHKQYRISSFSLRRAQKMERLVPSNCTLNTVLVHPAMLLKYAKTAAMTTCRIPVCTWFTGLECRITRGCRLKRTTLE